MSRIAEQPRRERRGLDPRAGGFSLIELVVVIVIMGLIAAIAIPRLSRGSDGAADANTAKNVAVLQKAVDLYAAEHGIYPDPDQVTEQLTRYTDGQGRVSPTKQSPYEFGPYVRKLPPLMTGPNKGSSAISTTAGPGIGWIYNPTSGVITANLGNGPTTQAAEAAGPATVSPAE